MTSLDRLCNTSRTRRCTRAGGNVGCEINIKRARRGPMNAVVMSQDTPMTTDDSTKVPRLRLSLLLWLAGMLGVVVITVTVLPQLLGEVTLPAPLWVISLASFAQSGLLIALAVWSGVALASKVGLH